jgi:predicted HNH restriction endonuclease
MKTKEKAYIHVKRSRNKKRDQLQLLKDGKKCSRCKNSFPHYCLDWHHLDKSTKLFTISRAMRDNIAWEKINKELEKCILLCKNCHAIIEWEETRKLIVNIEG